MGWLTALASPRLLFGIAVVAALLGAYVKGRFDGAAPAVAKLERERAAWANERTKAAELQAKALASEIEQFNALAERMKAQAASFAQERENGKQQVAAAAAALAAADRSADRLRDALATNRLATDAALAAAGATGQCAPAAEGARVLAELLGRFDAAAGRLAGFAQASSADADAQAGAARECAAWADAVRGSAAGPPS